MREQLPALGWGERGAVSGAQVECGRHAHWAERSHRHHPVTIVGGESGDGDGSAIHSLAQPRCRCGCVVNPRFWLDRIVGIGAQPVMRVN